MSEADWWVCARCTSLNNFAARRCYSCAAKKPKRPVRATQVLNYRVIESWDGKVTMEPRAPKQAEPDSGPRPLRVPAPRSIEAVARRAPYGSRVTYVPIDPVMYVRGAYALKQARMRSAPGSGAVQQSPTTRMPGQPGAAPRPVPPRPGAVPLPPTQVPPTAQQPHSAQPTQGPPPPTATPAAGGNGPQQAPVVAVGPGPPPTTPPRPTEVAPLWVARASRPAVGGPAADRASAPGEGATPDDAEATGHANESSPERAEAREPEAQQRQRAATPFLVPREPTPETGR